MLYSKFSLVISFIHSINSVHNSVQFSHSVVSTLCDLTDCSLPSFPVHQFSSVAQLCPTLRAHGLQHVRPPCPSPTPGVYPNSCPLRRWYHPTISSSVIPFSSCPQSFPASFLMSHFFASGGQIIGVSPSTSVLPVNTQDWSPLGWTLWISLQS